MGESTHQKNYRLMREHRDAAEAYLHLAENDKFAADALTAERLANAQVHATLALFYQDEVRV